MKKITLILLVAMVPFLTMAQKRSKKKDKQTTSSQVSVEYMVIKGIEIPMDIQGVDVDVDTRDVSDGEDLRSAMEMKRLLKPEVKLTVIFDYGSVRNKESSEMIKRSRSFGSMTVAANAAADKGWEFMSANIVSNQNSTIHYYYMKRNK